MIDLDLIKRVIVEVNEMQQSIANLTLRVATLEKEKAELEAIVNSTNQLPEAR